MISAEVNGKDAAAKPEATSGDTHITIRTGAVTAVEATIRLNDNEETLLAHAMPLPGDSAMPHSFCVMRKR